MIWQGKKSPRLHHGTCAAKRMPEHSLLCFRRGLCRSQAWGLYLHLTPSPIINFQRRTGLEGRSREGNRLIKQYQTPQEWDRISPNPTKPKHAMQQVRETIKRSYFKSIPLKGKYNVSVPLLENITFSTTRNFGNILYQQFAQQ